MYEIKAAIFDLDGTLADSMGVWNDIDAEFFLKRGVSEPDGYKDSVKTMNFESAALYTKNTLGISDTVEEIIAEWNKIAVNEYRHNIQLKPGVLRYLEFIKSAGLKIGLATASGRYLYEPLLKNHGIIHYFDAFLTTGEVGKSKDFPDIYLQMARLLKTDPSQCLVFEDILPAIRTAGAAGFHPVGVYDYYSSREMQAIKTAAEFYIMDFNEAPRPRPSVRQD